MSLKEFCFSVVLNELLRTLLSFCPAIAGLVEKGESIPLRTVAAERAVAEAARMN